MPSNSAIEKIKRAKNHLIAAKVLLASLPARYWREQETAETIDTISENLLESQEKIKAIRDPGTPRRKKKVS